MKKLSFIFVSILLFMFTNQPANAAELTPKEKGIVSISVLSAVGDLAKLKIAFVDGLDAGLTINDIKEILIQIAAYCGFPRSLNAINTFDAILKERKARGINDAEGIEPKILPQNADKYEIGKKNLERLTGRPETSKAGYAIFVPVIEVFLKEHLFADIFSRGVLSDRERELVTISALTALGDVNSQLQGHMSISMHLGITETEIKEMLKIVRADVGNYQADEGAGVLTKVVASRNREQ